MKITRPTPSGLSEACLGVHPGRMLKQNVNEGWPMQKMYCSVAVAVRQSYSYNCNSPGSVLAWRPETYYFSVSLSLITVHIKQKFPQKRKTHI